jgi:hypothetical protein
MGWFGQIQALACSVSAGKRQVRTWDGLNMWNKWIYYIFTVLYQQEAGHNMGWFEHMQLVASVNKRQARTWDGWNRWI